MNDKDNGDNNSVPLNADDAENVTIQELIGALNQACDEDRIGGDRT